MICISFAVFQGIMPLIGYFAASAFSVYISTFDHWIALILLVFIGGKMLYEALTEKEEVKCFTLTFKILLLQSVATSIDALAVGVSFSALDVNIVYAVSVIAVTTFLCCMDRYDHCSAFWGTARETCRSRRGNHFDWDWYKNIHRTHVF